MEQVQGGETARDSQEHTISHDGRVRHTEAAMTDLSITIPMTPPSVNSYVRHVRGRHYVTPGAKAFKDAIAILAQGRKVIAKLYQVDIHVFYGKKERCDLDNRAKCVLDGLQDAGVIVSDSRVTALNMGKHRDIHNPRTEIRIRAL